MDTKRMWFASVAGLMLSLAASPAVGQVCLGVPLNVGQTSLALGLDMPDGANTFGVRANNHLSGPLIVGANYALTSFDDDVSDSGSQHTVGAQVAADLPVGALANVGVCPVASVQATFFDGGNDIAVPLGVALGAGVEVDSGISVVPFAVPQFIWSRRSIDGVDDAFTDSSFGIRGGANLVVSNLFFGALINRSFEDNAETVFGVQGGIVF